MRKEDKKIFSSIEEADTVDRCSIEHYQLSVFDLLRLLMGKVIVYDHGEAGYIYLGKNDKD